MVAVSARFEIEIGRFLSFNHVVGVESLDLLILGLNLLDLLPQQLHLTAQLQVLRLKQLNVLDHLVVRLYLFDKRRVVRRVSHRARLSSTLRTAQQLSQTSLFSSARRLIHRFTSLR